jgi:hypothetical protein
MIIHTLLIQFTGPVSGQDVDQFLADIERASKETGALTSFAARRHLPVPGEEAIPALIATVIVELGVADLDALAALFAAEEVEGVFGSWRARHPFKAAWANHEPLT